MEAEPLDQARDRRSDVAGTDDSDASRTLLPAKTRAFVDFITEVFRRDRLAERFAGSLG